MSFISSFRLLVRIEILTPIAVLAALAAQPTIAQTVAEGETITTGLEAVPFGFTNNGTVTNADEDRPAIFGDSQLIGFTNNGTILGVRENQPAISLRRTTSTSSIVGYFRNASTGVIEAEGTGIDLQGGAIEFENAGSITARFRALEHYGDMEKFINDGVIGSLESDAIMLLNVESFANGAAGEITAAGDGVVFNSAHLVENAGLVSGGGNGFEIGDVGIFRNLAGGSVAGQSQGGIFVSGSVGDFDNSGTITSAEASAVLIEGDIHSLRNSGAMRSESTEDDDDEPEAYALFVGGDAELLDNSGTIEGTSYGILAGSVGHFSNSGTISAVNQALTLIDGGDLFENSGIIESQTGFGVAIYGALREGENAGTISTGGDFALLVRTDDGMERFVNSGMLMSDAIGAFFQGGMENFINSGDIHGRRANGLAFNGVVGVIDNSGSISTEGETGSDSSALNLDGETGVVRNTGIIVNRGGGGAGIRMIDVGDVVIHNSGEIAGSTGVNIVNGGSPAAVTLHNGGTLVGTGGVAVSFAEADNDLLVITDGSRIYGDLLFGGGRDVLDISGFKGNAVLRVGGLELVAGGENVHFLSPVPGSDFEEVNIVSLGGFSAVPRLADDFTRAFGSLLADQLAGLPRESGDEPFGYAPVQPAGFAEHALDDVLHRTQGPQVWVSALGAGRRSDGGTDAEARLGGLAAGAHVALGNGRSIGLAGSYLTGTSIAGEAQAETVAALLGAYGGLDLGLVKLDGSLIAGFGGHDGSRRIAALEDDETASASFSSYFVSPALGATIPILSGNGLGLGVRGEARYVGGLVAAYDETGSSADLDIGEQAFGVADARVGVEAEFVHGTLALSARLGGFGEIGLGDTDVEIGYLGQTQTASVGVASDFGLYAGLGLEAALTDILSVSGKVDVTAGQSGTRMIGGQLGISGRF